MPNHSIYGCKTKLRPFRLPESHFKQAVNTINAYLKSFRKEITKEEKAEALNQLKSAIAKIKAK